MMTMNTAKSSYSRPLPVTPRLLWMALLLSLAAPTAYGAIFTVNSFQDGADANPGNGTCLTAAGTCTLRAAIQEANNTGGPDNITLAAGTYTLSIVGSGEDLGASGDLDITESVTITGADQASTIIDGGGAAVGDRVFHISGASNVTISGVTIRNGQATNEPGGGLYNESTGTVSISNSTITANKAVNPGGAINGGNGGGINHAGFNGNLTYTMELDTVVISNNVSDTNQKGIGGGGIYTESKMRIRGSTLEGNAAINGANASGGGIQITGGAGLGFNPARVVLVNSTVRNNSAIEGAGIRNLYGNVAIDLTTVENNTASTSGGGIANAGGGMIINRTTLRSNSAGNTGGGITNLDAMDISSSAIYSNIAQGTIGPGAAPAPTGSGGGVYNDARGNLSLLNTTISNNTANEGGGLFNSREISVVNSTIYDNIAAKANGGFEVYACGTKDEAKGLTCANESSDVQTNFINSIVGNSSNSDICNGELSLITSRGNNLETHNTCGFNQVGDKVDSDPQFATVLQNNGGPTLTYALQVGSPAVNAGDANNCPAVDQRNRLRDLKLDACDIGAYEISDVEAGFGLADLKTTVAMEPRTSGTTTQLQVTITITNKGPDTATNLVLKVNYPSNQVFIEPAAIQGPGAGNCTMTDTGFQCSIASLAAFESIEVFVNAVPLVTGDIQVSADVIADQTDTYRPDANIVSTTNVNTLGGPSGVGGNQGGNNFQGSGGGGTIALYTLALLLPLAARRRQRR